MNTMKNNSVQKKAFMEIIHFGGKNHEFTIIKCENVAKNWSLLILFYRKILNFVNQTL